MKLKVRKKLAFEGAKPIAAILGRDSGISEMGRYLVVEATKEGLSYSVHRSDVVGRSTIHTKKVPTAGEGNSLMEISRTGRFVTDGDFLFGLLSKGAMETDFEIDFDPKDKKEASEEKEEEEKEGDEEKAPELQSIGTAKVKTAKIKATIGCVEDKIPPFKEFDGKKKVTFKGANLAQALAEVAIAAGESTMNKDWTYVKIFVSAGYAEIATTNGQQLAIAKIIGVDGEFSCIAPFSLLNSAVKQADQEKEITISLSKDDRGILVSYPLVYGGEDVGTVEYQLGTYDKFAKYEQRIKSINEVTTCKILTEELKNACSILAIVDISRTRLKVEPASKKITFQKTEARGSLDQVELPLAEASGKDIEVCISARHLEVAVAQADQEYVDLVFSGRNSLCKIKFGSFEQYFAPYTEA